MTISDEISIIANKLANEGKTPTVALIKSQLSQTTPLPQIITVLKHWQHEPTFIQPKQQDKVRTASTKHTPENETIKLLINHISKFLHLFGSARTHSDLFECIRMHSDAFGYIWSGRRCPAAPSLGLTPRGSVFSCCAACTVGSVFVPIISFRSFAFCCCFFYTTSECRTPHWGTAWRDCTYPSVLSVSSFVRTSGEEDLGACVGALFWPARLCERA